LLSTLVNVLQEGLAVASIAQDDPSTLPGDDPSTTMRGKFGSEFETYSAPVHFCHRQTDTQTVRRTLTL